MKTLEELKMKWAEKPSSSPNQSAYDNMSFTKVIKRRINQHTKDSMNYFWAAFVLQMIVYGLLSNVIVKNYRDSDILWLSIGVALLYLPFTIILMQKFKRLAIMKPSQQHNAAASIYDYVLQQQQLLTSFFRFKIWYEYLHIPVSVAIGVILIFKLYVPGGVYGHVTGATITFIISLLACAIAIKSENKKSFERPIQLLQNVLNEFKQGE